MERTTARPLAIGLTVIAGLARMAQNLNFAPVGALSLFAGARLRGWYAYALPIALMAVTDPFLGGYSAWPPSTGRHCWRAMSRLTGIRELALARQARQQRRKHWRSD